MSYTEDALRTESRVAAELFVNRMFLHSADSASPGIRLIHGLLGVQSEAGELADALKKTLYYGQPLDLVNVIEEIGDICWYLAILADACGTTLDECQRRNIAKLRQRYPAKFTEAEAATRDLQSEREALES